MDLIYWLVYILCILIRYIQCLWIDTTKAMSRRGFKLWLQCEIKSKLLAVVNKGYESRRHLEVNITSIDIK
jgi:hypothetical protein